MTTSTLTTTTIHHTTAAAHTSSGHSGALMALVILAAFVYAMAYRISLHRYPFKNCPDCRGTGKRRAPLFRAHRTCGRCSGSGDQLRRYARKP